jgi:hypothetical protein
MKRINTSLPFDLCRSTSAVRPLPFDLCRSTSAVRPLPFDLCRSTCLHIFLIGISTKTLWADAFPCAFFSKRAKKPPNTEGVYFDLISFYKFKTYFLTKITNTQFYQWKF